MLKKLLLLGSFLSMLLPLNAQTTLTPGDIAIIGINYDASPYEMTIMNLVTLDANTIVRITDYGYDNTISTFGITSVANAAEGCITWTLGSQMAAGTVTKFTINANAGSPIVTGLPGTVSITGWTFLTAASSPSPAGGDNWFIFQGPSTTSVTNYVFGWCNPFAVTHNGINQPAGQFLVTGSGSPNNGNSYLPPSLTLGTTAIALNRDPANAGYHGDNNVYTGIKTGTKAAILAAIGNKDNWLTNEGPAATVNPGSVYDISAGGASFPGTNPIFKIGVLLSSSPTLTFTQNSSDITGDNIASDGEGGSQSISDIDIQIYNISDTSGTLSTPLTWQNNSFLNSSSIPYTALTNPNNTGSKGMAIKSANGSEFRLNQFVYYNWGEDVPFTNTVKGYRNDSEVASTTFEGYNSPYNPTTITLPSSFENVDEVRFYITAGGYMGNQSASNHSINSIKVSSPVANSAPTDIALSANSIAENVAANTTVGALTSTDIDAGNTFTYILVTGAGDTDNAAFNISGGNLRITASPDFETKSSYSVRIRTTDQGSLNFEKVFTISITNVNEAPTDIALSANSIAENVAANSTIGTLSSTDADAGNTFTYTLVAGTGSTDNAAFNISGSNLRITASPDFETKSSYSVRIRTTDQGGLFFEKAFTISINDVCELDNSVVEIFGILVTHQVGASYQWYNCADDSPVGTNSAIFVPTQSGAYRVDITAGGCTVTSTCYTVAVLANPDFEQKSKFVMYPNPSQGTINVESDSSGDYQVVNQLGQIVKTFKINADIINTIELQNLNDGVFILKEINNTKNKSYKLIIKK